MAQLVKNPPAMRETWVQSLGWEDPLEKGKATHSSILAPVKVLHSMCQQIWRTQQWPQDWKRSVFVLIAKKDDAKECSNYCTIELISQSSKVDRKSVV